VWTPISRARAAAGATIAIFCPCRAPEADSGTGRDLASDIEDFGMRTRPARSIVETEGPRFTTTPRETE